jgi:L-alanine-DL-glutamate epimerase-like enolase superfamily enzyme
MTDVVRDGRPVVGFAFNSTGRYACGAAMRARFIPRILGADPRALLDQPQENFDPGKILAVMMQREKSGGHSERSIAIGTIEVAVWDAVAKIAGKPLHRCSPSATTTAGSPTRCSAMSAAAGTAPGRR